MDIDIQLAKELSINSENDDNISDSTNQFTFTSSPKDNEINEDTIYKTLKDKKIILALFRERVINTRKDYVEYTYQINSLQAKSRMYTKKLSLLYKSYNKEKINNDKLKQKIQNEKSLQTEYLNKIDGTNNHLKEIVNKISFSIMTTKNSIKNEKKNAFLTPRDLNIHCNSVISKNKDLPNAEHNRSAQTERRMPKFM